MEEQNHRMDKTIPRNLEVSSVHKVNLEANQQVVYSERQQGDRQVVLCLGVVVRHSGELEPIRSENLKSSKTRPVRKIWLPL